MGSNGSTGSSHDLASLSKYASAQWRAMHMGSMRLKKLGESPWIQYSGPGGRTFYFNEDTGKFQWERPLNARGASFTTGRIPSSSSSSPSYAAAAEALTGGRSATTAKAASRDDSGNNYEEGGSAADHWASAAAAMAAVSAWAKYPDPESGEFYYYNHDTGESSWEPPASGGYYEEGAGYGYDYEHHHHHEETAVAGGGAPGYDAAQPVHDLDDLGI